IVQESLTNVMRHAGPSTATVVLDRVGDGLNVRIEDDGRGASAAVDASASHGHGLSGMRERALAFGGTVDAGPRPGGGFRVRAWLPITTVVDDPDPDEPLGRPGPPWRSERNWHG